MLMTLWNALFNRSENWQSKKVKQDSNGLSVHVYKDFTVQVIQILDKFEFHVYDIEFKQLYCGHEYISHEDALLAAVRCIEEYIKTQGIK